MSVDVGIPGAGQAADPAAGFGEGPTRTARLRPIAKVALPIVALVAGTF